MLPRFAPVLILIASTIALAQPDTATLLQQARKLHSEGKTAEARPLYEQLIPRLRMEKDFKKLGTALYLISLLYSDSGEYSRGLEFAREAAGICRNLGDTAGEARSTNSIGLALLDLGDYRNALGNFQHALDLHHARAELEDEVVVLNNIGNVYFYQAKYLEAFERYNTAMQVVDRTTNEEWNHHERQRTTANLAVLFQKLGRYDLALGLYTKLRSLPEILSPVENARVLANLGTLYRRLGDPVKALEIYNSARESFKAQRHVDGEMGVLKNIGIAEALDFADLPAALESFHNAASLAGKSSNRRESVQAHLYSGEALRLMSRFEDASAEFQTALSGARALGTIEEQWKALYGLAQVDRASLHTGSALNRIREAVTLVESVRSRVGISSLKTEFLADKRDVYDAGIELLLDDIGKRGTEPAFKEEVHRMMDRARARVFKDQMEEALGSAGGDRQLAQHLRELRGRMSLVWNRQLRADAAEKDRLRSEYSSLEDRYVDAERRLYSSSARPGGAELSIAEIQSRLNDDTVLLEYWTGKEAIAFLWIVRSGSGLVKRSLSSGNADRMRGCIDSISVADSSSWRESCGGVGKLLLGEVLQYLAPGRRNLIVVPEQHLAFLPMEILEIPGTNDLVVDRFNVSYLPSASMLAKANKGHRLLMPWSPSLMAIGDPIPAAQSKGDTAVLSSAREYAPLPYSKLEVESIAELLGGRKRLHLGRDAVKDQLLDGTPHRFPLVHLSTHAVVDSEDPQRSRIVFSPSRAAGSRYLFLGEILDVDLRGTDLITLSACDTAVGKLVRGEGPQDFSRAFLLSGAGSTLATLWRVADDPTAEFMKQFYFYLSKGYSKTESLRRAKLRFLSSGAPLSHPYYWAAFVLSGDGMSPVSRPVSWAAFLLISSGVILLLVLLFPIITTRAQRSR